MTGIKSQPDGMDFFFSQRNHAQKLLDFLQAVVPMKFRASEKLISHDEHSNIYNYKFSFSVEIAPICRDDLLCLDPKGAHSMGNISQLLICYKISSTIHLIDPLTLQVCEYNPLAYWKNPFKAVSTSRQLIPYVILDVVLAGPRTSKFALADCQVARESDFGSNDTIFNATTHLGNILKPGDFVLGHDLSTSNYNDDNFEALQRNKKRNLPDLFLVKKYYPGRRNKKKNRHWKLKDLPKETEYVNKSDLDKEGREYEKFLEELEEDPELRGQVNLYKADGHAPSDDHEMAESDEEDFPEVRLEELIDEMSLNEKAEEIDT
jgi:nonsense-mediated mRNA decay protein 3